MISQVTGCCPTCTCAFVPRCLSNICLIYERKTAPHVWNGKQLLLRCHHISWNCEKWWVVTGSRMIISLKRSHALSSLRPQTWYVCQWICSEMNPWKQSQYNNRCWFSTDEGIFALAVAYPFSMLLPNGHMAVIWKWIYIRGVTIMIQLHVVEDSPA